MSQQTLPCTPLSPRTAEGGNFFAEVSSVLK